MMLKARRPMGCPPREAVIVTFHVPAMESRPMPRYRPPSTCESFASLRMAGMFIVGIAGMENTAVTSASVIAVPSGCLTVTAIVLSPAIGLRQPWRRFNPKPRNDFGLVSPKTCDATPGDTRQQRPGGRGVATRQATRQLKSSQPLPVGVAKNASRDTTRQATDVAATELRSGPPVLLRNAPPP